MKRVRLESRLPWQRGQYEVEVPEGASALAIFRAAGFADEAAHVLFVAAGGVCLDEEAPPEGAVLEVFPRMHGG